MSSHYDERAVYREAPAGAGCVLHLAESPGCGSRSTPRGSRLCSRKSIRRYLISIRPRWRRGWSAGDAEASWRSPGGTDDRPPARTRPFVAAPSCTVGILDAWVTHPGDIGDGRRHITSTPTTTATTLSFCSSVYCLCPSQVT